VGREVERRKIKVKRGRMGEGLYGSSFFLYALAVLLREVP
jgi:hypothetical protein